MKNLYTASGRYEGRHPRTNDRMDIQFTRVVWAHSWTDAKQIVVDHYAKHGVRITAMAIEEALGVPEDPRPDRVVTEFGGDGA